MAKDIATASTDLSIDDILATDDREYVTVEVPEWPKNGKPGTVRLRNLSNSELIEYTEAMEGDKQAKKRGNLELVRRSAINASGGPLFTEAQVTLMLEKSAKAFNRLAKAALKLNGVTDDDTKAAKNG